MYRLTVLFALIALAAANPFTPRTPSRPGTFTPRTPAKPAPKPPAPKTPAKPAPPKAPAPGKPLSQGPPQTNTEMDIVHWNCCKHFRKMAQYLDPEGIKKDPKTGMVILPFSITQDGGKTHHSLNYLAASKYIMDLDLDCPTGQKCSCPAGSVETDASFNNPTGKRVCCQHGTYSTTLLKQSYAVCSNLTAW